MTEQREIKFRAWDIVNETMTRPFTINEYADDHDEEFGQGEFPFVGEYLGSVSGVLMQYTGLKDKNGKEIYESDIVRPDNPEDWYDERYQSSNYRVVEWNAPEFEPFDSYSQREGPYGFSPEECEVIGNIYENPDMLKK